MEVCARCPRVNLKPQSGKFVAALYLRAVPPRDTIHGCHRRYLGYNRSPKSDRPASNRNGRAKAPFSQTREVDAELSGAGAQRHEVICGRGAVYSPATHLFGLRVAPLFGNTRLFIYYLRIGSWGSKNGAYIRSHFVF